MKVNITGGPRTLAGMAVRDENREEVSYRTLIENALNNAFPDEMHPNPPITGEEKLRRWQLSIAVHNANGSIDLTAEQIALIKKLAAKSYTTPISAQLWLRLEGVDPDADRMPDA